MNDEFYSVHYSSTTMFVGPFVRCKLEGLLSVYIKGHITVYARKLITHHSSLHIY
jgi:hypothetical protein